LSWAAVAAALLSVALAGCGFQLRGDSPTGLKSLYVSNDVPSQVALDVRRALASSPTVVMRAPANAEAHLRILTENREKTIYTITGAGRVYEFQLRLIVTYQMNLPGREDPVIPTSEIDVRREVTYSETAPLAKEAEENLLYRDMVADAAGQILRRIAAVRRAGLT
jgi:LPS-assembly lipoprotein